MSKTVKTVLDTIREYTQDHENAESLRTAELEIDLCDKMSEFRQDADMTQAELADQLGVSQGYIAKLENGAYDRCGIGTLRRFAIALGYDIDLDHLFTPLEGYKWPRGITISASASDVSSAQSLLETTFTGFLLSGCEDDAEKVAA